MTIVGVTRELLVRYLDAWTPTALHAAKRATFIHAWSGPPDAEGAEAALRVFAEFTDRLRGRRLAYVTVAPDVGGLAGRLDAVQAELRTPANLAVHTVAGSPEEMLGAALVAAGGAGAPLLVCAEVAAPPVQVATAGRPVELLSILPPGDWPAQRTTLTGAGFPLTTGVEFVDGDDASLVSFATGSAKSLEAFKNALWAVDEYAGVRYRDPHDTHGHLLDISLNPHPGPLRRALLAHLAAAGPGTVTELRHFALADTVYRAIDATHVITALLTAGTVASSAPHGRLAGDAVISLANPPAR